MAGDVFVLDAYRGRGLGKWLVEVIPSSHRSYRNFARWVLATKDAHEIFVSLASLNSSDLSAGWSGPDPQMQETPTTAGRDSIDQVEFTFKHT